MPDTSTLNQADPVAGPIDDITVVDRAAFDGPSDDTYDPLPDQTVSTTTVERATGVETHRRPPWKGTPAFFPEAP